MSAVYTKVATDPPPAPDRGGEGAAVHGRPRTDYRGVERHPVHQSG